MANNTYYIKTLPNRQAEIIHAFNKAFPKWTRDITPIRFPSNKYLHVFIYLIDGETAQLIFGANPPSQSYLAKCVTLPTYTDIPMLPLMDVGITASKQYEQN